MNHRNSSCCSYGDSLLDRVSFLQPDLHAIFESCELAATFLWKTVDPIKLFIEMISRLKFLLCFIARKLPV